MGFVNDPTNPVYQDFTSRLNARSGNSSATQSTGGGRARRVAASGNDRDILIRTIIGEAGNEGPDGQAAVAHNILNRVSHSGYPDTIKGVALQPMQYSTWNDADAPTGDAIRGGNNLATKYNPGDKAYDRVAAVVDQVLTGQIPDATNGAINYYAPSGMKNGMAPRWWNTAVKQGGGNITEIGGHRFAGKSNNRGAQINDDVLGEEQALVRAALQDPRPDSKQRFMDNAKAISMDNLNPAPVVHDPLNDDPVDDDYMSSNAGDLFRDFAANNRGSTNLLDNPAFARLVNSQHEETRAALTRDLS